MQKLREIRWGPLAMELFVVFIGLFAALQLDQWRESRELELAQTRYLLRLKADLEGIITESQPRIRLLERNHAAVGQVYESLVAGTLVDGDRRRFELGLIYVTTLPSTVMSRAAYEEMVASGMFARLGSEAMKQAVSDLYSRQDYFERNFNWWRRGTLLLGAELNRTVEFFVTDGEAEGFGVLPNEPVRGVRYDFEALRERLDIRNGFYEAMDVHNDWVDAHRTLERLAKQALAALDEELAGRGG